MNVFFMIILASILEYLGDSNFKFFARESSVKAFGLGTMFYIALIYMLIKILSVSNVMYMNMLWDATSIVIETVLAYILLAERLDNIYQVIGFVIILIGILLLNVGKVPK